MVIAGQYARANTAVSGAGAPHRTQTIRGSWSSSLTIEGDERGNVVTGRGLDVAFASRRTAPACDEEAALRGSLVDELVPTGDHVRVGALERGRPLQKARLDPFKPRRDICRETIDRDLLLRTRPVGRRQPLGHHDRARRDVQLGPTSSRIGTPHSSQWLNL